MTFVHYCTYIVRIICIACGNNTVTLSYEADETNKTRSGVITFLLATVSERQAPPIHARPRLNQNVLIQS